MNFSLPKAISSLKMAQIGLLGDFIGDSRQEFTDFSSIAKGQRLGHNLGFVERASAPIFRAGQFPLVHGKAKELKGVPFNCIEERPTDMNIVSKEVKLIVARQSEFAPKSVNPQAQSLSLLVIAEYDQSDDKIGAGTLSEFEACIARLIHKNKHGLLYL